MKTYGSLVNRMEEGAEFGKPYVGMGATEMLYSDRRPYTVQKVVSDKRVVVTADKYERTDNNGRSEDQDYKYVPTPLFVGEKEWRCSDAVRWNLASRGLCAYRAEHGTCEGCKLAKLAAPTNGVTLIKAKRGWKRVGQNTYFALGFRERYEDPTF